MVSGGLVSYTVQVDNRYAELKDRIVACLGRYAQVFKAAGFVVSGPDDWSDDVYAHAIVIEGGGLPESVDIRLEMPESLSYDGTHAGVNFGLDIVGYGGRVIGGLTPYNWTPDVWVAVGDSKAVSDRLAMIEESDPSEAVKLVREAYSLPDNPADCDPGDCTGH